MVTPTEWLAAHQGTGAPAAEALAVWDDLPPIEVPAMFGRWRGSGLPTGHPWDGLLEAFGWYGKEFLDAERVHPLLMRASGGRVVPIDPRWMPVEAMIRWRPPLVGFGLVRPFLVTKRPAARLRAVEFGGKVSAAMIYDRLPIVDLFRKVDERTVMGRMDLRGLEPPFLFVLRRE